MSVETIQNAFRAAFTQPLPSPMEGALFVLVLAMFIIWVLLVHYSVINRLVSTSRCIREKKKFSRGANYSVGAYDGYNNQMYQVDYDLLNKSFVNSCKCTPGTNVNTFNIDVYNMKTNRKQKTTKDCSCDKYFDTTDPTFKTYHKGYPGLIRFMDEGNTDIFYNLK